MTSFILPAGYHLERPPVPIGSARIWAAALCISDEATSHVQVLVDPYHNPTVNTDIEDTWLVVHTDNGTSVDVGMALLTKPTDSSRGRPVLHLYVNGDHQNLGLGTALLKTAQSIHPSLCGHHTLDAVRLYQAHSVPPAQVILTDQIAAIKHAQGWEEAEKAYSAEVLKERVEFDRVFAHYRQRR